MALIDEYTAAQNQTLINRVQIAAVGFAVEVIEGEPTNTPNYNNRVRYAQNVVANPAAYSTALTSGVVSLLQATDPNAITDININNSIAAIWNMYAGLI
jgi:hypothetical protein